jgi:hypothetical protein
LQVTKLVDLLDEAVLRAKAQLTERMNVEGGTSQMTPAEIDEAANR